MHPGSPFALMALATSDAGRRRFYVTEWSSLKSGTVEWRPVSGLDDGVTSATPFGDRLYLVSHDQAPRYKLLSTSALKPDLKTAKTILPPGQAIISGDYLGINALFPAQDALYVQLLDAGAGALVRLPWTSIETNVGVSPARIPLPYVASITNVATDPLLPGAMLSISGWVHAGDVLSFDPASAQLTDNSLQSHVPQDNPLVWKKRTSPWSPAMEQRCLLR